MNDLAGVIHILREAPSVGLLCHANPDGDTLGSALALYHTLQAVGKEVVVYCPDPVPEWVRKSLPGTEACTQDATVLDKVYVLCWVDCGDEKRSGAEAEKRYHEPGRVILNVDHHGTNPRFGTAYYVEETAACAEIVFRLIKEAGWPISREAGICLYAGLVTDTGRFTYPSTTGETLRITAELLDAGVDPDPVIEKFYRTSSEGRIRLLGACLSTLTPVEGGRAWMLTGTRSVQEACGAVGADYESIVNYAVEIEGAEVGALIREVGENRWKVSLRSRGRIPVDRLAASWGGGGHAAAAGASLEGSRAEAEDQLRKGLEKLIHEWDYKRT